MKRKATHQLNKANIPVTAWNGVSSKSLRRHFHAIGMDRLYPLANSSHGPCEWLMQAWRDVLDRGATTEELAVLTTAVHGACMGENENEANLYRALCSVVCQFFLGFPDTRFHPTVPVMSLVYRNSAPAIKNSLFGLLLANQRGFGCGVWLAPSVMWVLIYSHILPQLLRDAADNALKRIRSICHTANYLDRFWVRSQQHFGSTSEFTLPGGAQL